MNTKIITLINTKGGVGKTTLTMNIGVTLSVRHSKKIAILDCDKQRSATKWAYNSEEENGFPCAVFSLAEFHGNTHKEIRKLVGMYDYIIIDCPPNKDALINASVLLVTDLAIIPAVPTSIDMRAIDDDTIPLIEAATINNEKLKSVVVISRTNDTNLYKTVEKKYRKNSKIPVLTTKIKTRVIYCETELTGESVYTSNVSSAKNEMALLTDEIIEHLQN
jgi:chromosome partitioning protein